VISFHYSSCNSAREKAKALVRGSSLKLVDESVCHTGVEIPEHPANENLRCEGKGISDENGHYDPFHRFHYMPCFFCEKLKSQFETLVL
jgi:hypothetical protein